LSREEESQFAIATGLADRDVGRELCSCQRAERVIERIAVAVAADERGAMLELRARGREGVGDVDEIEVGMASEVVTELLGLIAQSALALG
jgi:hypothetical protein